MTWNSDSDDHVAAVYNFKNPNDEANLTCTDVRPRL